MPAVTKERLLQPAKLTREKVALPAEYGEDAYVWLQAISAPDLMEMRHRFGPTANIEMQEFRAHILRLSLINDDGSPMFARAKDTGLSEEEAAKVADAEVAAFLGTTAGLFQRLAGRALALSEIMTVLTDDEGEEKN